MGAASLATLRICCSTACYWASGTGLKQQLYIWTLLPVTWAGLVASKRTWVAVLALPGLMLLLVPLHLHLALAATLLNSLRAASSASCGVKGTRTGAYCKEDSRAECRAHHKTS
jgi:hypothetical protein